MASKILSLETSVQVLQKQIGELIGKVEKWEVKIRKDNHNTLITLIFGIGHCLNTWMLPF